jgi:hypothetical protein
MRFRVVILGSRFAQEELVIHPGISFDDITGIIPFDILPAAIIHCEQNEIFSRA